MSTVKCTDKGQEIQNILEYLVIQANSICQFSQRDTELNAIRFVEVLVLGWLRRGRASLNDLSEMALDLGCNITGAAIHERINRVAVILLGQVLMQALQQQIKVPQEVIEVFSEFTAVYITDSTQLSLPMALAGLFAGGNHDAKMKLQVTIDYLTGQWIDLEIEPGKASDRKSDFPVRQAVCGSLNVFDLGYFKQERFRDIAQQGAFFVSRYQSQTGLYTLDSCEHLHLVTTLKSAKTNELDTMMRLGERVQFPVRLVARKLPKDVVEKRRRKAKQKAKEQKYTCSADYLYLLSWDILITNLDHDTWSISQLFNLYAIRMQIEWVFRIWKSQLQLDHLGKWRVERILCQLYAHLIGILLCHRLTQGWLWRFGHEHSFAKCVQIMTNKMEGLMICIGNNWMGVQTWIQRLEGSFTRYGCKTKRKKEPSTLQVLMEKGLS